MEWYTENIVQFVIYYWDEFSQLVAHFLSFLNDITKW